MADEGAELPATQRATAAAAVVRVSEDLKWAAWNAAWHAANSLAHAPSEASLDLRRFEAHAAEAAAHLPHELALHIRAMVWSACWHAANSRGVGLRSAAARGRMIDRRWAPKPCAAAEQR